MYQLQFAQQNIMVYCIKDFSLRSIDIPHEYHVFIEIKLYFINNINKGVLRRVVLSKVIYWELESMSYLSIKDFYHLPKGFWKIRVKTY